MASMRAGGGANTRPSDQEQLRALLRHRWGRALLAAAAVALLAVAAAGGFRKAGTQGARYPVSGAGQRMETGAFALTPLRGWTADALPGQQPGGKRYVLLRLRAENLTESGFAAAALLQQDIVWLPDGRPPERKADTMRRADDGTLSFVLQPRLPAVLDIAWEVPPGETPRSPLTWGVYGRHYAERGYLQGDGDAGWKQDDPLFKIVLDAGAPPPEAE